jgi:hypothetical protein
MIKVIRQKDDLNREVWEFRELQKYINSPITVILNLYSIEERFTKRHKWVSTRAYDRHDQRRSFLQVSEVPLPDDVRQEALEEFIETVRVVKEDEETLGVRSKTLG